MVVGSYPDVSIGELAEIRLGVSDKFFQCRSWDRRMDCYDESINCQAHYRVQILVWVVERPGLQEGLIGVNCRAPEEKSVAVGPRARDCGSTQRTGCAPDIIDEYRA